MARRRRGKRNGGGPIIQEFEEWSAKGCKCSDKNQGWVEGSLGKAQIMSRGTAGDYRMEQYSTGTSPLAPNICDAN